VPLEWAFASPLELQRRLGKPLDPKAIAQMDPEALAAAFSSRPALHRYPGSMSTRVQELAKLVVERYDGKTEGIWNGAASGDELLRRVKELPGFGEQKAKIFVALLGKQLGVRPEGWDAVSTPFSDTGSFRSVADITDVETLNRVRAFKQALKAANKAKGSNKEAQKTGKAQSTAKATKKAGRPATTSTATRPTRGKAPSPAAQTARSKAAAAPAKAATARSRATAASGKR
jgi:uncharacterized HhH-GPD family protein